MIVWCLRRAAWIAVGVLSGRYLDPDRGPERRQKLLHASSQCLATRIKRVRNHAPGRSPTGAASGRAEPGDEQLGAGSVTSDLVRARASETSAEEAAAGVPTPAPPAMAAQILAESEARIARRGARSAG